MYPLLHAVLRSRAGQQGGDNADASRLANEMKTIASECGD